MKKIKIKSIIYLIPMIIIFITIVIIFYKQYASTIEIIKSAYESNTQLIEQNIYNQKQLFLRSMMLISILYCGFAFIIIYLINANQKIAHEDYLTKLPNRKRFEEVLETKISEANRKHTKIAVLFFDLDDFKIINDTHGHGTGDRVLQMVADIIKGEIPKGDIISRLGGDEFAGFISGISEEKEIAEIGERMIAQFKAVFNVDSIKLSVTPSMGISIYPDHGDTVETLISKADSAMYEVKDNKLRYKIYKD